MIPPIKINNSKFHTSNVPDDRIIKDIQTHLEDDKSIDVDSYDMVTAQVIHNGPGKPSHIILRLFQKNNRTFDIKKIEIDSNYQVMGGIKHNYKLTDIDHNNQPHHETFQEGTMRK